MVSIWINIVQLLFLASKSSIINIISGYLRSLENRLHHNLEVGVFKLAREMEREEEEEEEEKEL